MAAEGVHMNRHVQLLLFILFFSYTFPLWAADAAPISSIAEIPKVIVQPDPGVGTANSQITVISSTQIRQSGAYYLSQLLQGQPGVFVQDINGDNNRIAVSMRGFGANAAAN
jgi:iron complex outermembrane recepter protein